MVLIIIGFIAGFATAARMAYVNHKALDERRRASRYEGALCERWHELERFVSERQDIGRNREG